MSAKSGERARRLNGFEILLRVITDDLPSFRRDLLSWYDRHRRDLPWRSVVADTGRPDPYHVLLSEFMLQQTQVATVVPYFARFLERFPTVAALAAADEQDVLRMWQGLGYYSRARNLLKAARAVVEQHGGVVPSTVEALLTLPGVGRYTAGAIASIAHGTRAPIVDGNVVRVICRLDAIRGDPRDKKIVALLWARAEQLVPDDRPGDLNSALMELGATVCAPRSPQCLICPVARHCAARDQQLQYEIPPPKLAKATPLFARTIYCLHRARGDGATEYAFEQRPADGRWASMWQFVTRDPAESLPIAVADATSLGTVTHGLTHRRYEFSVLRGTPEDAASVSARWMTLAESEAVPLPKPHVVVRERLRSL